MAAKLTLIKKIVNDEVVNSFNLIMNMLFGGSVPGTYDETKVYHKGSCVLVLQDGKYKLLVAIKDNITGPFNPDNFSEIIFTDLLKDSSILTQNNKLIQSKQEAMTDDISTLLYELAGLFDNRLSLNTLYRENFKSSEFINITTGMHAPGSIHAIPGNGIDFQLKNPVELKTMPNSFKIKHIIELSGAPTLGCSITFNALDDSPYWFNANNALLSSDFFEIPMNRFIKDDSKPYALDIRIYGNCPNEATIKLSDLMVVFI